MRRWSDVFRRSVTTRVRWFLTACSQPHHASTMKLDWVPRRWRRGTILGVASLVALIPSPAMAYSVDQTFGPTGPGGGYGNYNGTLFFSGARAFNYTIYVQDICPADGFGVSYYFIVRRKSDNHSTTSPPKAWDTNGCDNGVEEGSGSITREWNIGDAQVAACWTNDGELCWSVPLGGVSGNKDNPYT